MKHWPFSATPREAFHPERAALVDQLVAFLGEHVEDIARLDAQELAERIDELGLDITELMDETLSKKLLGGGALDFFSACLLESKELLLRLVNKPTSKSNKLTFTTKYLNIKQEKKRKTQLISFFKRRQQGPAG